MLKPEQCPLAVYKLDGHTLWIDPAGDEDGALVWWTVAGEDTHRSVNYMVGYVAEVDVRHVVDLSEAALRIALYNLDGSGELGGLAGRLRAWADAAESLVWARERA